MKKQIFAGILTSAMVLSMATLSNASTRLEISQQTTDGLDAGSHTINTTFTPTVPKNNYEELYSKTLNELRQSLEIADFSSGYTYEVPYIYQLYSDEAENLGYDYLDLNNDGTPELFIGVIGEAGSLIAFSIIDDEVVRIAYRDYRYGATLSASGTFYEWGSNSAFHSSVTESIYTGVNLEYDWYGDPKLEPINFYHFLAYRDFMSESQYGYYTAANEAIFGNINSLNSVTAVSDEVMDAFKERMEKGYPFDYTPLRTNGNTTEKNENTDEERLNFSQETGLLFDVTYLSDPYPCYVTFYQDGTYNLQANLGVGYGTDLGTYTIQNNQILCTIQDRQWSGFVWEDVNTYSFFVTDGKLTFQIVDTYYAKDAFGKVYLLDNFCYMDNGAILTSSTQHPTSPTYSSWATSHIVKAETNDLIVDSLGMNYTKSITRSQIADLLVNMVEKYTELTLLPADNTTFSDTTNISVLKANQAGIISGMGDGTFAPNSTATREQIAMMIYKTILVMEEATGTEIVTKNTTLGQYNDSSAISSWAIEAVAILANNGIMEGTGDGNLSPLSTASIEQGIILNNALFALK